MKQEFDTIVIGLGAMGSSSAYHLTKSNQRVLGIDQFACAHDKGSSHGKSRLIRQAYFEHSSYVPLLKRSYELWEALEEESQRRLFHRTGVVIFGPETGGSVLPGVRDSSQRHAIPTEEISITQIRQRFPAFKVPDGFTGIFEPGAGFLEVENCVEAYCRCAKQRGAELHFDETVISWSVSRSHVSVKTNKATYSAASLVIAGGAWSGQLLGEFGMKLNVHRVPIFWFDGGESHSEENRFPCFAFDLPYGFIYGFPWKNGEGIKIAPHIPGDGVVDPTHLDRTPSEQDLKLVTRFVKDHLPEIPLQPITHAMCMYTMSFDSHFIIDQHPEHSNVVFACGFSGHGFKFASVVGEIITDLVQFKKTRHPIDFLRMRAS